MSRFGMSGYELGRPTRRCASTGRELAVGEAYIAVLVDHDGSPKPARLDYSVQAWTEGRRPVSDDRLIGSWKTVVHAAGDKPKPILDDETMLELFDATAGDKRRAGLRLVLALMLIRRRVLAHEGNRGSAMLVRIRGTPRANGAEIIEVPDPGLDESTLAEVIMEMESLAGGEPATPDAAPTEHDVVVQPSPQGSPA
ncbi:MAG: hypothetical protein ACREJO_13900 [Phycisphaerales bacterium]